jgi:hypothetical protein
MGPVAQLMASPHPKSNGQPNTPARRTALPAAVGALAAGLDLGRSCSHSARPGVDILDIRLGYPCYTAK